jgi:hypothetical protein
MIDKGKEKTEMKNNLGRKLVWALVVLGGAAQAFAAVNSKDVVVDFPSDLPEFAQRHTEAMYLYETGHNEVLLYLEQDRGRKLSILDVTDPAKIKTVGQQSIDAPSAFDFVQPLRGGSSVLIHFRNHSGFGVISLRNSKEPELKPEPNYLHPATMQKDGPNTLLFVSAKNASAQSQEVQYEIVNVANTSDPTPLATIQGVVQRLDRPESGSIFLLTDNGLSVIRCLQREKAYQENLYDENDN